MCLSSLLDYKLLEGQDRILFIVFSMVLDHCLVCDNQLRFVASNCILLYNKHFFKCFLCQVLFPEGARSRISYFSLLLRGSQYEGDREVREIEK